MAALPVATEAQVPFLFPLNGDPHIRRTENRFLFTATASFEDEIDRLVEHVTTIGARRISVAYLSNPFGKSILEAAEVAMKARRLTVRSSVSFDLQGDRTKAARDLAATSPDAVILGAMASSAADFIRAYRATGSSAVLLAFSGVGVDIVHKQAGADAAGLVVSQIVPFPLSSSIPIVAEYQAISRARGVGDFTQLGLCGHISARTLVEGLRRAGRNLRRQGLMEAIEAMRNVDLGHYVVDFSPTKHHGSRFVDITLLSRTGLLVK